MHVRISLFKPNNITGKCYFLKWAPTTLSLINKEKVKGKEVYAYIVFNITTRFPSNSPTQL